ncbi:hypothetical protein ERO13_D09G145300v2 [Gossypium hirsutum]|uniref:Uncharacterized protein isoform X2 n=5 Tax=Gossypium TaxID=3633 RepID=A0A1U8HZ67_GOSHI|nr:uncharacterized protein LOC105799783 [Gossypium raimondii]XP_016671302.1 uncharacterized protein LOC107891133 isoform X2 [Gossypium hirsutum]KAB2013543.1 hypothetical protein ES319_D09G163600v1 [Gossypium barbadense]TYG54319.1 hypothetical protein ES288_D09G179600v1 [Gossypium darwinii]TYH54531.1 hypothetical protein ES332_D09G175100v1 [Gossypium tomentosum]KAG4130459.1 hypothetical protein ERO13_D09G145300v2 [Gossypium hirsutum]KJB36596.1 hypothetical protein B456_006G166500 [Gossypium ra
MVGRERRIFVGLAVAMFLGITVYFRLWMIDYSVSSHDTELLRRQFDLANKEAMDESAEWRLRFDEEADKASKCAKELEKIKESIVKKEDSISFNNKLALLQKENAALLERVETLKNKLEDEKMRCRHLQ